MYAFLIMLLPFVPVANPLSPILFIADLGLLFIVVAGLRDGANGAFSRSDIRSKILFAFLLPALGAIAYLPWPLFQSFYGLPFMLGPALILALSVTALERLGRGGRTVLVMAAGAAVVVMVSASQWSVGRSTAGLRVAHATKDALGRFASSDSMFFAVRSMPQLDWFGLGATIRRQASAEGRSLPPVRHVLCEEAEHLAGKFEGPAVIVIPVAACGSIEHSGVVLTEPFRWFDSRRMRVVTDSVSIIVVSRSPQRERFLVKPQSQ